MRSPGLICDSVAGLSPSQGGLKDGGLGIASREHSMPTESMWTQAVCLSPSEDMRIFPGTGLFVCIVEGLVCEYGDGGWLIGS